MHCCKFTELAQATQPSVKWWWLLAKLTRNKSQRTGNRCLQIADRHVHMQHSSDVQLSTAWGVDLWRYIYRWRLCAPYIHSKQTENFAHYYRLESITIIIQRIIFTIKDLNRGLSTFCTLAGVGRYRLPSTRWAGAVSANFRAKMGLSKHMLSNPKT